MDCPNCHKDVEVLVKNYGALFTCPQCQAVYFVNFDGQAEYSEIIEPEPSSESAKYQNDFQTDAVIDDFAGADPLFTSFENPMSALGPVENIDSALETPGQSEFSMIAREISDFGNSDVQIASLNYDVEITGLDSKEEVSAFKDSIDDSRFGWDVSEIMKRLRHGAIKIEKLNPVQAFILSKRIRFLNADVKWRQNVLA